MPTWESKWNDYREEDFLRPHLGLFHRRVDKARGAVQEWLGRSNRPYIACSGGKDSVAMTHLVQNTARQMGLPLLPIMWHDSGVEFPQVPEVFERLRAMGLLDEMVIARPECDVLDLKRQQHAGLISMAKKDDLALFAPIKEAVRERGFDGAAIGLRSQESRARRMRRRVFGLVFDRSDGVCVCIPLADWEWQDVFGYIALHGLPLHPIYSAPLWHLENRGRIRLSWWASTDYAERGVVFWLKMNFPDLYRQFVAAVPEARGYA